MEALRNNPKEMLEIKNTITEIKKAFVGPISRLAMTEKRISEHEDTSIELPQLKRREKSEKDGTEYP